MDFLDRAPAPRRRFLHLLAGAVLASIACLFVSVRAADAATVPARTANSFVESIGVNTHFYYGDTPYVENFPVVKQRLAELGVNHIRENIAPSTNPGQIKRLNELGALGIKSDLILGVPTNGTAKLEEMLNTVKTQLSGSVDAVEGPNEWDQSGNPNWVNLLREYQQRLYASVKSNPALSGLTVVGPSIVTAADEEKLGQIPGMLDVGSMHTYAPNFVPEKLVPECLERAQLNAGTAKPSWATEAGYNTAMNYEGSLPPVSEAAQAAYMPRLLLENYRVGFQRTYMYELLDEAPDPSQENREDHWGLLRNDLTPKPAFTAIKNLVSLLKDPGAEFTPDSLAVNVGGNTSELHQVLLQKRDGSYYLALWRASSLWSTQARTAMVATSSAVNLSFGQPIAKAEKFLPDSSTAAVESLNSPKAMSLEVGPEVVLVKLTPGEGEAPEAGAPVSTPVEEETTPTPPVTTPVPPVTLPVETPVSVPVSTTAPSTTSPATSPSNTTLGSTTTTHSGSATVGNETTKGQGTTPAPTAGTSPSGGKKTSGGGKVSVWPGRKSVRAGQTIAIRGRVTAAVSQVPVAVERWEAGWKVVGSGHTSTTGNFQAKVKLAADGPRVEKLRVVTAQAASPAIQVHVLD
jgi:hypothetical protein